MSLHKIIQQRVRDVSLRFADKATDNALKLIDIQVRLDFLSKFDNSLQLFVKSLAIGTGRVASVGRDVPAAGTAATNRNATIIRRLALARLRGKGRIRMKFFIYAFLILVR